MTHVTDIKKAISDKKAVIGGKRTLKEAKNGKISVVFLSENCPENIKKAVDNIKNVDKNMKVFILTIDNVELGTLCKKPFSVACLGVRSDSKNKA